MLRDSINQEIGLTSMAQYLFNGIQLCFTKDCRMFVILPIFINLIVMVAGAFACYYVISTFLATFLNDVLPEFLSFLTWIIGFILWMTIGFVFCYLFSTIATIIASPFYGLLAERAENLIRGAPFASQDDSFSDILKDVPRIIGRELQKLAFYLPRVLVCLIITFIPFIQVVAPLAWFLLAAWMMSVQYVDYAYDNHKIAFADMRKELATHRLATFSMGAVICIGMTIPVLNLFIPPAAVCAGTRYYVEMQRRYTLDAALR